MLVYLADLSHTYTTKNESLMVPLNIGYLKAFILKQHGSNINIKLFKDPNELLKAFYKKCPDLLGLSNYGWNEDLNFKLGKFIKLEFPKTIIISGGPNLDEETDGRINFLKKNDYISYYLVDGGEEPFSELITWFINDKKTDTPKNIIYLKENLEKIGGGIHDDPRNYLNCEKCNQPSLINWTNKYHCYFISCSTFSKTKCEWIKNPWFYPKS